MTKRLTNWKVGVGDETTSAMFQPSLNPIGNVSLVLAHGAGTNMSHTNMDRLADVFIGRGLDVVRFNFLYKERGGGGPDRMPKLKACYAAVVEKLRKQKSPRHVLLGGHSMGGRVASMLAADGFDCDGLILLGYPLHPSGQPEKLRGEHLPDIQAPVLCLNGTRDPLCTRELMDDVVKKLPKRFRMHWLEAADHGYKVPKRSGRTYEEVLEEIGDAARGWVDGVTKRRVPSVPPFVSGPS